MLVCEILSGSFKCICGSINGNLLRKIWCSRRVWSAFLWVAVNYCRSGRCVLLCFFNPPDDEQMFLQPGSWHRNCGTSLALGSSVCVVDDGSVWHSRTLEESAYDLFPLKFGNAPQTSPWFLPLSSCIWNRLSCPRLDSLILSPFGLSSD